MKLHFLPFLAVLATVLGVAANPALPRKEPLDGCAYDCAARLTRDDHDGWASLCSGSTTQTTYLQCLSTTCHSGYGPALVSYLTGCLDLGATLPTVYPVDFQHHSLVQRQFVPTGLGPVLEGDSVNGIQQDFTFTVECNAGSDGVLTLSLPDPTPVTGSPCPHSDGDTQEGPSGSEGNLSSLPAGDAVPSATSNVSPTTSSAVPCNSVPTRTGDPTSQDSVADLASDAPASSPSVDQASTSTISEWDYKATTAEPTSNVAASSTSPVSDNGSEPSASGSSPTTDSGDAQASEATTTDGGIGSDTSQTSVIPEPSATLDGDESDDKDDSGLDSDREGSLPPPASGQLPEGDKSSQPSSTFVESSPSESGAAPPAPISADSDAGTSTNTVPPESSVATTSQPTSTFVESSPSDSGAGSPADVSAEPTEGSETVRNPTSRPTSTFLESSPSETSAADAGEAPPSDVTLWPNPSSSQVTSEAVSTLADSAIDQTIMTATTITFIKAEPPSGWVPYSLTAATSTFDVPQEETLWPVPTPTTTIYIDDEPGRIEGVVIVTVFGTDERESQSAVLTASDMDAAISAIPSWVTFPDTAQVMKRDTNTDMACAAPEETKGSFLKSTHDSDSDSGSDSEKVDVVPATGASAPWVITLGLLLANYLLAIVVAEVLA